MIGNVGAHRIDHANVVNVFGRLFEQFADIDSRLAVLFKRKRRLHHVAGGPFSAQRSRRRSLAVKIWQVGFVIKRVDLAGAAVHKQMDNVFRSRLEMQLACPGALAKQHVGQSDRAEAGSAVS